nr:immunoglobulin light chain junction region [Macaca mulatta]
DYYCQVWHNSNDPYIF